jgi:hypothetical protein
MRLSIIRSCVVATVAALALAACAGHGIAPSSPSAFVPDASSGVDLSPLKLTTCATSPPQYDWIFKGACDEFTLKSTGGKFSLQQYEDITITGLIGKNDVKGKATIALVDAIDKKGDIEKYDKTSFPPYKASGTTIVYAAAINQSSQTIKPIAVAGKPVLQYVITDSKGLPGNTCGAAVLAHEKTGGLKWTPLPATGPIKGDTVTISQYEVPSGFELPPKADETPIYFAVNCYKS